MKALPWLGMIFFALVATIGWYKALQTSNPSVRIENTSPIQKEEPPEKMASPFSKTKQKRGSPVSKSSTTSFKQKKTWPVEKSKEAEIQKKAHRMAKEMVVEQMETYKKEEAEKKKEQVFHYFDNMETLFTRSIDVYASEFEAEDAIVEQLHQIVEDSFVKQREISNLYYEEELSEKEAKSLGKQAQQNDKILIMELLGEDGAKDFGSIVREVGAQMKSESLQD